MTLKAGLKRILAVAGIDYRSIYGRLFHWSLRAAIRQQSVARLLPRLGAIQPNLSQQYSRQSGMLGTFQELKIRALHSFQCELVLDELSSRDGEGEVTIVDIGDSAGTHMRYVAALAAPACRVNAISVNLDQRAIDKIRAGGGTALLCRAEDLDLGERAVDLFVTFEMLEHLHNPALFLRRLAKSKNGARLLVTVPYQKQSRVGLQSLRRGDRLEDYAEDVHIYEFCPEDWRLLMLHSGWRVEREATYFQYPRGIPIVSSFLARLWRQNDFEGFWGAVLVRDLTLSDRYLDWDD